MENIDTKKILEKLRGLDPKIKERYKIKEIGVFGSTIRGEQHRKSDIDVLVDFKETPDLLEFIALERRLQRFLGRKVDLVRKQAIRVELKDKILKETVSV